MIPVGRYGEIDRECAATKHTRSPSLAASPRNGEARWPDNQVVDTMSAEGRSLRVDGLGVCIVSLVSSDPKSQNMYVRRQGAPKPVERYILPIPIPDITIIIYTQNHTYA
jgi:hypothetical protein